MVLPGENLVADPRNQIVRLHRQTPIGPIGGGGAALQDCIGGNHLAWDEVVADTEVLERALRLWSP